MPSQSSTRRRAATEGNGRALGWISGLGLLVVPVVVAGVLATAGTMVRPDSWGAESTFPWLLLAAFSAAIGWIVYGSVRIEGFRRGAVPGTAVAAAVIAGIYLLARVIGP